MLVSLTSFSNLLQNLSYVEMFLFMLQYVKALTSIQEFRVSTNA
jgi:hypothetical protein